MVTYKCDVCGEEFHDNSRLILGKTYYIEHKGKSIDKWHGDVCRDCCDEIAYVGECAMMDWIVNKQKEGMTNAGDH